MEKLDSDLVINLELVAIGLASLVSLACCCIIIWEIRFSFASENEDRNSFDRSMIAVSVAGIVFNMYHTVFLIELRGGESGLTTRILTDVSRALYTLFMYSIVIVLLKLKISPTMKYDKCIYPSILLPTLTVLLVSLCRTLVVVDTTLSWELHLLTSSILLVVLDLLPLLVLLTFFLRIGRSILEGFIITASRRIAILTAVHLLFSTVYNVLYSFVLCQNWDCHNNNNIELSPLQADVRSARMTSYWSTTASPDSTTSPATLGPFWPNTTMSTSPSPPSPDLTITAFVLGAELASQIFISSIPVAYLHSVFCILRDVHTETDTA